MSVKATLFAYSVSWLMVRMLACECNETREDPISNCELRDSFTIHCSVARNLYDHEIAVWSFASNKSMIGCCSNIKCTVYLKSFIPSYTTHIFLLTLNGQRFAIRLHDYKFCLENVSASETIYSKNICAKSIGRITSCYSNASVTRASYAYSNEQTCPCNDGNIEMQESSSHNLDNAFEGNITPVNYPVRNTYTDTGTVANTAAVTFEDHHNKSNTVTSSGIAENPPCIRNKDDSFVPYIFGSVGLAFFVFCVLEIWKRLFRRGFQACNRARFRRQSQSYHIPEGKSKPCDAELPIPSLELKTKVRIDCDDIPSNKTEHIREGLCDTQIITEQHQVNEARNTEDIKEQCKRCGELFTQAQTIIVCTRKGQDTYLDHSSLEAGASGRSILDCETTDRCASLRNSAVNHLYYSIDDIKDWFKKSSDTRTLHPAVPNQMIERVVGNDGGIKEILIPEVDENHQDGSDESDESDEREMNSHNEYVNTQHLKGSMEISHQNHQFRPCWTDAMIPNRHSYVNTSHSNHKVTADDQQNGSDESSNNEIYTSHVYLNTPRSKVDQRTTHKGNYSTEYYEQQMTNPLAYINTHRVNLDWQSLQSHSQFPAPPPLPSKK